MNQVDPPPRNEGGCSGERISQFFGISKHGLNREDGPLSVPDVLAFLVVDGPRDEVVKVGLLGHVWCLDDVEAALGPG